MTITKTAFDGLLIVDPQVFTDTRGYFVETYHEGRYQKSGMPMKFVQDNQSRSKRNVIRGLHFQRPPYAQTKLVRCIDGRIWDVAVDLRRDQPTYKKAFCIELSAENKRQVLIPQGFAHGFSVLSDFAEVLYKCDTYYHPESAGGIFYRDSELNIDWKISAESAVISEADNKLPALEASLGYF